MMEGEQWFKSESDFLESYYNVIKKQCFLSKNIPTRHTPIIFLNNT